MSSDSTFSTHEPGFRRPHPQATTALVLGILGLALCFVCAPLAWGIGSKAVKEIDANPAEWEGRGQAQAGKVLGIVGVTIWVILIFGFIGLMVLGAGLGSVFEEQDLYLPEPDSYGLSVYQR